jgi:hypothetical protein
MPRRLFVEDERKVLSARQRMIDSVAKETARER